MRRWWQYNAKYRLGKLRERLLMKLAWAVPRDVAYWVTIRMMANATTGRYSNQVVPELTVEQILNRWEYRGERASA